MSNLIKVLVVRDGAHPTHPDDVFITVLKPSELTYEVGGDLEIVYPTVAGAPSWSAYCDENGKLLGRPINTLATSLARAAGWQTGDVLCGTVVFVGLQDGEGDETDVPDDLVHVAELLWGPPDEG